VRKINRLGFESAKILEDYFSKYGQVTQVLVSHSHAKSRNLRFRPSGLGFLVMENTEAAEAILADGPDIRIFLASLARGNKDGLVINVQGFKRQFDLQNLDEAEQAEQ
jgi:hypothetical protein